MKTEAILLAKRPVGLPGPDTFEFVQRDLPELRDGELLLRTLWLSVDPYMRGRMNDVKSYTPPFPVGEPIRGGGIGEVVESRHPAFRPGDLVTGDLPWQRHAVSDGRGIRAVPAGLTPVTAALGVVGMTGLTAYFGLLEIGRPKPGETVVISGAAGAVGGVAGQIAKLNGCRVVGIAGSQEKVRYITEELGFDAGINYRTDDLRSALREACPNGVDVYFDNVGGAVTDAVVFQMNDFGRIILCGQIAAYNLERPELGPRLFPLFVMRRLSAQGFIVSDFSRRFDEGTRRLAAWHQEGRIQSRETVVEGFERLPDAFLGLFRGDNIGKLLVKVADPEHR
ncbi:NADP-dependent oxidoreductase [Alicyclobacillus sp.]|uniref:NADP-dependent oxidoreductase n=1 Tax=Alicyclobacillus sp. TaxID=61169 RepID=UPI0025C0C177|nr:NADP-dependent oxidoreductase [Alicyclobacillus sp.]MCL6516766.1 NADP-dependent oxidoreductase [Alicyclobacillus sp.]